MNSKESKALEPFFNSPRHWHFEEIRAREGISKSRLSNWLKKFEKEGVIKRVKEKGKMPYYIQNFGNPSFKMKKRLFAMTKLYESGLLSHLATLPKAKVVILFGSFAREDWHDKSDIDIFICGKDDSFEQGKYELLLKREIQVHLAKGKKDLKKMEKMLPYIIQGNFIKGSVEDLGVEVRAKN